jgi:hypothetical protein
VTTLQCQTRHSHPDAFACGYSVGTLSSDPLLAKHISALFTYNAPPCITRHQCTTTQSPTLHAVCTQASDPVSCFRVTRGRPRITLALSRRTRTARNNHAQDLETIELAEQCRSPSKDIHTYISPVSMVHRPEVGVTPIQNVLAKFCH